MKYDRKRISSQQRWSLAASQSFKCRLCNETLTEYVEVDHIKALSNGGSNALTNLQVLCAECHLRKTTLEARCRNSADRSIHCEWCDVRFSRYFWRSHLHRSDKKVKTKIHSLDL